MLGTTNTGVYGPSSVEGEYRHGEVRACEVCGDERHCIEHCGFYACATCRTEILP